MSVRTFIPHLFASKLKQLPGCVIPFLISKIRIRIHINLSHMLTPSLDSLHKTLQYKLIYLKLISIYNYELRSENVIRQVNVSVCVLTTGSVNYTS